ncbi:hypothetical protein SODALDRAFT_13891 [Sodiomyces alkalinus F11]|uniref:Uncharacterized protein n=1 Tax=Sodiomyces alkalinus (strain CBS 110278 / VKM F-3762 / F11) TaxID=1314773 RepID=A0A3N2Q6Y4_SODAK|nr:hypothetical protein SODALDRAFT_13891 [Sodiomyces alkalinus F11]ROT42375.1 hypothetical protein SODALDRAFT_13891 [Sodiomyces alkalinus F11]
MENIRKDKKKYSALPVVCAPWSKRPTYIVLENQTSKRDRERKERHFRIPLCRRPDCSCSIFRWYNYSSRIQAEAPEELSQSLLFDSVAPLPQRLLHPEKYPLVEDG